MPTVESMTHRIVLLRGENPEVLLSLEGTQRTLPEIRMPRWQRVAEHLTAALSKTYGIDAVLLSSLEATPVESHSEHFFYEVMEACDPRSEAPPHRDWVAVDCLTPSAFRNGSDLQAVRDAVARSMATAEGASDGPFGKLGWFRDLQRWVQNKIRTHGLHLNGRFRQLNGSPTFSLIRFETNGPAVWFKAVGDPNQREYPLTLALARAFRRFLPQIVAIRPEWNGWLTREADGALLYESSSLASWESVARDLTELQIQSIGRVLHLLDLGARDLRTKPLAGLVAPFFQALRELMERQTKIPPSALSRDELGCLSLQVQDAVAVLEESGISSTLGHLDLNPGNIVCSPTQCVFLDWAEAFVGHPFLTLQYLLEHFRRTFGHGQAQEAQLVIRYSAPWRALVFESDLRRALEVAPLVAAFACAAGNGLWTDPRNLEEPRTAGHLRSLARRMQREAHALAKGSLPCLG